MKLTTILMIVCIMQVSANGFAQKVSLSEKGATMKNIFRKIKLQTGYDFVYAAENLKGIRPVDIQAKNEELKTVLDKIFQGQQLEYRIEDRYVVVSKKETDFIETVKDKITGFFLADSVLYRGRVLDENGSPLAGASIKRKGASTGVNTSEQGLFAIKGPKEGVVLLISYVGYAQKEVRLSSNQEGIDVRMTTASTDLNGVEIVSNGYQNIARERATGSFEVITAKQLEHSSSPSLLKRLEGITTLSFNNRATPTISESAANRNQSPLANITIRGKNTLTASTTAFNNSGFPLLVIDGIASAYDIDQINPEDVEDITILKDAASASIWGSRAANGVIVIRTKKGRYGQKPSVSFSSSVNMSDKPDLFYRPKMSVSDYIDAQRLEFIQSGTVITDPNPNLVTAQSARTPVAEILNNWINKKTITEAQANAQLDALRGNDVRRDVSKYLLRGDFNQNYSLGIAGGSKIMTYRLSGGYSNSIGNTQNNGFDRLTVGYSTSVKPFKGMEINGALGYTKQNRDFQGSGTFVTTDYTQFQPYAVLADENGNPLSVPKKYRPAYLDLIKNAYGSRILDMTYKPLEEMDLGSFNSKVQGININMNAVYSFNTSLSANVTYGYNRNIVDDRTYYDKNSFYMRDMINRFTDRTTFARVLPNAGYLETGRALTTGNTLRGQLNFNHIWNEKHALNAVTGIEGGENFSYQTTQNPYFGYDPETLNFKNTLNYVTPYTTLWNSVTTGGSTEALVYNPGMFSNRNRRLSSFLNFAYTYNNRYTVSGSVRKDGSNLFGVTQNKTGTPFYSAGASWNIANEGFYHFAFVPKLQLRADFGYNGNTNPLTFPRPRITYSTSSGLNGLFFASAANGEATNNDLRPEKVGMLNIGLDFGIKGDRLSGSLEYYVKNVKDLISSNLLDPSTGFTNLNYNTGNLHGYGIDLMLNSQNLKTGKFSWNSNFLVAYNRNKVSKLYVPGGVTAGALITGFGSSQYNEGYDLDRIFAFPWAGLDPATGKPRILFNGQALTISDTQQGRANYSTVYNGPTSGAKFIGSAVPVYQGAIRNTFSYGQLTISANIIYKLKYFSRRPGSDLSLSGDLYGNSWLTGEEFSRRWQKPGDEVFTNVPSMTYPSDIYSDDVYPNSDINVIKADHIRLQEINLSYGFRRPEWHLKNVRLFANVTNLGILWRANRLGIDPDINDVPQPRTYSFGLNASF